MKKLLYFIGAIVLIFAFAISWALADMYKITGLYYKEGTAFYKNQSYMFAIKGDQKLKPGYNVRYLSGGFQQVIQAWEYAPLFIKPAFVSNAASNIDKIIDEDITIKDGEEIYSYYIGYDNEYLGRIKLRVGDLYLKEGNKEKALKAYQTVKSSFSYDSQLVKMAEQKIDSIETVK